MAGLVEPVNLQDGSTGRGGEDSIRGIHWKGTGTIRIKIVDPGGVQPDPDPTIKKKSSRVQI